MTAALSLIKLSARFPRTLTYVSDHLLAHEMLGTQRWPAGNRLSKLGRCQSKTYTHLSLIHLPVMGMRRRSV
ncbi:hypothetical protein XELAEV_18038405mg [Xenopus laevis]|uniref:Uncharacterized protein n=1 Tax=Xenopus laevis TaxID=8355 RepID=A0A974C5W0_XENLA|nr:hypothetical protein XELAEV_18038405mg [Xenopus laevis]